MAKIIALNKITDTMTEGVLVKWNIKAGDTVKSGDLIGEVETDKATMDLENFEKGTVLELLVEEGATVPIGAPILVIGEKGEDYSKQLADARANVGSSDGDSDKKEEAESTPQTTSDNNSPAVSTPQPVSNNATTDGRIKASPLAKKLAADKGIDLSMVSGTGEGGRIIKKDVENYTPSAGATTSFAVGQESFEEIPVSQMRKTIAGRLAESKYTAPHFYLTMEVEMDNVLNARKQINANRETKISVNDIIIKAVASALRQHPAVNSSWLGNKIRINHHIHVGVAVAVEDGLLVPVVRFADQKPLSVISAEVKEFAKKAAEKKLQPQDWAGNTFTVSNLGMFGIDEFTAIINPPDAAILAIGAAKDVLSLVNGNVVSKKVMKVTLSCDHRVVDGATGSKFLQTFKNCMENPLMMMV